MDFDVLIKKGLLVDGTGAPGRMADIGIINDRIEAIGQLSSSSAKLEIDAFGKIVSPGFIDVHVHSELSLLGGIDQYAPLKMGVTTQLMSPDGFSWAGLSKSRLKEQTSYLHVFYDELIIDTNEDMSIERYLSMFRGKLPSNIALQAPHGSIRLEVLGWEDRAATEDELKRMEGLVRNWMEVGAVSFCTGLEYEPMRRADLHELVRLSKVASEYNGIYVAHQRGYTHNFATGAKETFTIAELANIPVHISHLFVDDNVHQHIQHSTDRELQISFDMYPYPAGCSSLLLSLPWEMQLGSPDEVKSKLKQKSMREKYVKQLVTTIPLDRARFAAVGSKEPTGWEGKTLLEVQEEMGLDLADTICEILLLTELQTLLIYHWPNEWHAYLKPTFEHPLHMLSTDGIYVGKRPHPRGYGTYPKVLGEYVRENKWLNVEQAIYKMSGYPAKKFNIKQRGILAKGNYADVVVFDPNQINSFASFENPRQEPLGIDCVMVNGHMAVQQNHIHQKYHGKIL